jgi:hypothetical protein
METRGEIMKTKYSFKKIHWKISAFLLVLIFSSDFSISQNTKVSWYSFNMGYGEPAGSNTIIKSVVGQNIVGISQQSNTVIISGFLADTLFRWTVVGVPDQEEIPTSYSLGQNYPNPFNPSTTIQFDVPKTSIVTLKVYNMLGQEVATLVDEKREAGKYEVVLNGSEMSSGVYFYRLQARTIDGVRVNDYVNTKKLLLVK